MGDNNKKSRKSVPSTYWLTIRLTPKERDCVKKLAKKNGQTLSDYCRDKLIYESRRQGA